MNVLLMTVLVVTSAITIVLQKSVLLPLLFIAVAVICVYRYTRGKRFKVVVWLTLIFLIFVGSTRLHEMWNVTQLTGTEDQFVFTVAERFHVDGDLLQGVVKTNAGERLLLRMRLTREEEQRIAEHASPGSRCQATGELQRPHAARNFFAFDYQEYLYTKRIHWQWQVEPDSLACTSANFVDNARYFFTAWRTSMIQAVAREFPDEIKGAVLALTFGERRYIDGNLLDAYADLGIIHLLAISGLHVGIVSAAVYYALLRVGVTRERAQIWMLCLLPVFALLTGAAPPVVRASAMAFVVFLFVRFHFRLHPLYGIVVILFASLLVDPYQLFQLGFQLSFLVSFTLLLAANTIQSRYTSGLARLFVVSTIAQLVGLPLIFYHFFEWSALSLLLNLVYIPFVSMFVLPMSFIAVLLYFFVPITPNVAVILLEVILPPVHRFVFALQESSLGTFVLGKPHPLLIVCMYGAIYFIFVAWEARYRLWIHSPVPLLVFLSIQWFIPYLNPNATVTMIDVGQGDSFVIESPFRRSVTVIDTGGVMSFVKEGWQRRARTFDTGKDQVSAYLKAKGIKTIDQLVLTHGDGDHIGGTEGVLAEMNVREVIYPARAISKDRAHEHALLTDIKEKGVPIRFVQAGEKLVVPGQTLHVLSPHANSTFSLNDDSIVLFALVGGVSFLFTGDIEEEGERALLQQFPNIEAIVLKVGHHGSRTSTSASLLQQVNPQLALISAGVNNRFGHPHPDVIDRLKGEEISIYQTNVNGMVLLTLRDGDITTIDQFKEE